MMTRLTRAEFRKLLTTRLWLWLLAASAAWTAGYSALAIGFGGGRGGGLTPSLAGAAGQHALFAIGAGGAGPLAAILGAIGVTGEYRHNTAAATFLATPARSRVIAAKLITYLIAGAGYAVACIAVSLAVSLPWLAARGIDVPPAGNGNLAVLAAVVASAAIFGAAGTGAGALAGGQLTAVTGLLIYLYVAEPLLSHITALHGWTAYLPGVAADGLTQAIQAGVLLLTPWLGGVVFAGWAAALAAAGTLRTIRRDIT
jgi:ABC-type transport system involved in multi-copper enzyme maturation permease subunit